MRLGKKPTVAHAAPPRMRATAMPGEDPMTLPTADEVAEKIFELGLPSCAETGKLYDFYAKKFFELVPPA